MQRFIITGGSRLSGELTLQGSKNSALPIMAAALLGEGESVLKSCPALTDVYSASRILGCLGCKCSISGGTAVIDPCGAEGAEISEELMREMRSSIMFMGAILGRTGECAVSIPGGCELGPRPINLHLDAMRAMGVRIREGAGRIFCTAEKLTGAKKRLHILRDCIAEALVIVSCHSRNTLLFRSLSQLFDPLEPNRCI